VPLVGGIYRLDSLSDGTSADFRRSSSHDRAGLGPISLVGGTPGSQSDENSERARHRARGLAVRFGRILGLDKKSRILLWVGIGAGIGEHQPAQVEDPHRRGWHRTKSLR